MILSPNSTLLLPIGLGLLGFIEPCTIGGHLLFLDTQKSRTPRQRITAVSIFIVVRSIVAGLFGALVAWLGGRLIGVQTGIWLLFGLIYLSIGLMFISGRTSRIRKQINLAPAAWKRATSPLVLGLAFGLNIPACAAPILFALLGLATTTGTVVTGFVMMFLFGLFLSLPLAVLAVVPILADQLQKLAVRLSGARWITGGIFVILGLWSIWFGLFVDPANWAGQ